MGSFQQKIRRRYRRYILLSFFSVFAFLSLAAQQKLGRFSAVILEAKPLEISQPLIDRSESAEILNELGGISSVSTASPEPDLRVRSLQMTYNSSNNDGSRLELKINKKDIVCDIPDWQLLPLVQYVNSPNNACITLLGELADKELEKKIKMHDGYIVNYHPAFMHTQMGMYLLQNEISMLFPDSEDNPAITERQKRIIDIQKNLAEKHRSWILSEMQDEIYFSVQESGLNIPITPEYYFWRYASDAPDMDKSNQRFNAMTRILQHEFEADLALYNEGYLEETYFRKVILERTLAAIPEMIDQHNSLAEAHFGEVNLRNIAEAYRSGKLKEYLASLSTGELVETWNMAVQINTLYRVQQMDAYSSALNAEINQMQGIDPEAWDATRSLMKYSSFFRYVKKSYPQIWEKFTASLDGEDLKDTVQTPTAIYPSDNLVLE